MAQTLREAHIFCSSDRHLPFVLTNLQLWSFGLVQRRGSKIDFLEFILIQPVKEQREGRAVCAQVSAAWEVGTCQCPTWSGRGCECLLSCLQHYHKHWLLCIRKGYVLAGITVPKWVGWSFSITFRAMCMNFCKQWFNTKFAQFLITIMLPWQEANKEILWFFCIPVIRISPQHLATTPLPH